ncbi:hypothetical protein LF41_1308 [Lysobacter dokdonensis DS-58]|uniref:Uncharacterized protein n=1 Tax=Lysobacter dokdonensis DS-58 TaxID=1300345 RepID=A0A0A2WLT0_9GAMM|nr:hypothetical protein [Lysobacter dokdonensis]KGQ20768.1 hypothetical protein LF41_1308 [Lysobacter dokdonensis DS-58]
MAITYSQQKQAEWNAFKANGGSITFEIDGTDISDDASFEKLPSLQSLLKTGFEIPPTPLIETAELQSLIQVHGSEWDYILCRIYLAGGRVIYLQLPNGQYEATCTVP